MKCEQCQKNDATVVLSDKGQQQQLCSSCYNDLVSDEIGVSLEPQIERFSVKDYNGEIREFKIDQHLHPNGIYMEAAELIEIGYKFAVHGELDCNQTKLFNQLMEKVKRGVATSYVNEEIMPNKVADQGSIGWLS